MYSTVLEVFSKGPFFTRVISEHEKSRVQLFFVPIGRRWLVAKPLTSFFIRKSYACVGGRKFQT